MEGERQNGRGMENGRGTENRTEKGMGKGSEKGTGTNERITVRNVLIMLQKCEMNGFALKMFLECV